MQTDKKREFEKRVICEMIDLYARKNHKEDECEKLKAYALKRIDLCPFMETKTFCSACKIHCYQKEMREQIREVMRYSGPRMLLYHPVLALKHLYIDKQDLFRKVLYLAIGFIGLGLGFLGAVLPLLPAFPFLLMAAWGFGRSSEKLHIWFTGTNLYKKNLESWVKHRAMDKPTKIRVLSMISIVFVIGLYFTRRLPWVQLIILCVWVGHVFYFVFKMKTLDPKTVEEAKPASAV